MKKLAYIIVSLAVLVLSACGGQPKHYSSGKVNKVKYSTVGSSTSDDTVLWINKDGTDCDLGDLLEGDKDCYKTKKTVYYKAPKKSLVSKLKTTHHVTTTTTTTTTTKTTKPVTKKKVIVPTTPKKVPKKTVTYKRSKPSYSKPKTTTTRSYTRTTRTTKRR